MGRHFGYSSSSHGLLGHTLPALWPKMVCLCLVNMDGWILTKETVRGGPPDSVL